MIPVMQHVLRDPDHIYIPRVGHAQIIGEMLFAGRTCEYYVRNPDGSTGRIYASEAFDPTNVVQGPWRI